MTRFEPLPFEPGYRRVAAAIAARILDRSLREGDPLPAETELAEQFAVNRSTVREALRELESADLVARRRGSKRMVITRPASERMAGRFGQSLALNDVTVREVWRTLELIEPSLAAEAARAADEQAITRLQAAVDHFGADHADAAAAVAGVADFFRAVAAATGNRVVALTQEPLLLLLLAGLEIMIDQAPQARRRIATAQQHICAAIRTHDADTARDWMSRHIRDFRRGFEVSGIDLDSPVAAPR